MAKIPIHHLFFSFFLQTYINYDLVCCCIFKHQRKLHFYLLFSTTSVKDLIYWRDVRTTGVVFGSMLVVLISLAIFSLLSVLAYLSLACLSVTFTFVVYKKVMGAVQKSTDGHPFK